MISNIQDKTTENLKNVIPHSRPTLGSEEESRVAAVIRSGHIGQGNTVQEFEKAFSQMVGIKNAACTNSGTSALHLALLGMGVGQDDEVIIPSYVCTALLNAVQYTGAKPVFADIDPETFNIDPKDVKKRLTKKTRAVIVPHMFGLPADLDRLLALDVPLIEDCAQAVGSTYQDKQIGTFGYAAIYSFYATKVMTTGEGGMVVSDARDFIESIKELREYDQKDQYKIRYNYKMTDMNAALGIAQLGKLEFFIQKRREIAEKYKKVFQAFPFELPAKKNGHIYFRYVLNVHSDSGIWIKMLKNRGIVCARPVYYPLHQYQNLPGYPNAEKAWKQTLSIPIYPSLSEENINRIIKAITEIHERS